jgi:hypothetical protein
MKSPFFPLLSAILLAASLAAAPKLPVDPSRWWGFNLMEKVDVGWHKNAPYREEDFAMTADLGFNYLRLPIDYRCITASNDWLSFREDILKHLDQAVAWGEKYKVHVTLGYHRAPGYCINPPLEAKNLWTNSEALAAFTAHWEMLARRYANVPTERLTFNLVNEPSGASRADVVRVYGHVVAAIRRIDARRVVFLDGGEGGKNPWPEFAAYTNVIQSGRGYYEPVTHFRASYRDKSRDHMPTPVWPMQPGVNGNLYGTDKAKDGLKLPLVLTGSFKAGTQIALNVMVVSRKCDLQVRADGQEVWRKLFEPKDGKGEWQQVVYSQQWKLYQNIYGREFGFTLAADSKELAFENLDGDWLRFSELLLTPPGGQRVKLLADATPRRPQGRYAVTADGQIPPPADFNPEYPVTQLLAPWKAVEAQGATVFMGEFGSFNRTPHAVWLGFMESWLKQCRQAHYGWAVWNLRGEYGVLDSGRADVAYEDYRGHKLDRKMMDLLVKYTKP